MAKQDNTKQDNTKVEGSNSIGPATEAPIPVTKESLMSDLQEAMASNDWQKVAKLGASIAKHDALIKRQEREELEASVAEVANSIKSDIEEALETHLDNPTIEKCDGVWYSWDFGTGVKSIRLLTSNAKTSSKSANITGSAGSVGKKFNITTGAMLEQLGDEQYKDSGMTAREFHDSTTDGNKRYSLRVWLLKESGYTS